MPVARLVTMQLVGNHSMKLVARYNAGSVS